MSPSFKLVLLILLSIVLVGEAAAAAVIVLHRSKNHSGGPAGNNSQAQTEPASSNKACSIFTLADAKQALNGDAIGGAMAVTGSSNDVQVSGCNYKLSSNTSVSGTPAKSASLVVHLPQTATGIASNQKIFDGQRPPDALAVSSYGDQAFWDGSLGQLDILKHNVWYVLTYGAATPADRSLAQTKQLADILKAQL